MTKISEKLLTVKRIVLDRQNNKLSTAIKMAEPGFLGVEILAKDPEKAQEKIGLVHKVVSLLIDITQKQKRMLSQYGLTRINTALTNEIAICEDILDENGLNELIRRIDLLKEKIIISLEEIKKI